MTWYETLCTGLLNMEWAAAWTILLVLVLRAVLTAVHAPHYFSYALWAVAGFRLACPVSFSALFSLLPSAAPVARDIALSPVPQVQTNLPLVDRTVNAGLAAWAAPAPAASANPLQVWFFLAAVVWLAGLAGLLGYSLVSVWRLARRLRGAACLGSAAALTGLPVRRKDVPVYACAGLAGPFVFGLRRPGIYLPPGLPADQQRYILLHELTHIDRADILYKPLAWLLVCVHWFDPLVWLAFFLLEKDMELSCDEAVLARLGQRHKKPYAQTLLAAASGRWRPGGCPVHFGESNIPARIRSALRYRRPAALVTAAAFLAVTVLTVGCAANPLPADSPAETDSRPAASTPSRPDSTASAGSVPDSESPASPAQSSSTAGGDLAASSETAASAGTNTDAVRPAGSGTLDMFVEGMAEQVPATWQAGDGWRILIPDADFTGDGTGYWQAVHNAYVAVWVEPCPDGQTAEEALDSLTRDGYTVLPDEDVPAAMQATAEQVHMVWLYTLDTGCWAVHTIRPSGTEYAEGWGARLPVIARSFAAVPEN